jgi:hypothetical protein
MGFVVLSYAGTLTITVVSDPDQFPELPAALQAELDALVRSPAAEARDPGRG